jgi:hypothetical protein
MTAATLMLAGIALSGCGSQIADMPAPFGLPEGTPARPASELPYPAVHEMPEPRATKPLTNDELRAAAAELEAARKRLQGAPSKPTVQRTSTTTTGRGTESTGASRNP